MAYAENTSVSIEKSQADIQSTQREFPVPSVDIWSWVIFNPDGKFHLSHAVLDKTLCGIARKGLGSNISPSHQSDACRTCLASYYSGPIDGPTFYPGNLRPCDLREHFA